MQPKMYDGVSGVTRKIAKAYDGVSGVTRKSKKEYDGIAGVARLYHTGLYTWAKYTSYVASTSTSYGDYTIVNDRMENIISPLGFEPLDYCVLVGTGMYGDEYRFTTYDDFKYDKATGTVTLVGKREYYANDNTWFNESLLEEEFAGRYVYLDGEARFIYAYYFENGRVYLKVGQVIRPGDKITTYTYAYSYVEDVQSDNPNAFPEGSTAGYTSLSSNDIRTVYVRVERD